MLTVPPKTCSRWFIWKFLLVCLAFCAFTARAATITVPIEVSDQDLLSDGTARFVGGTSSRVGLGYSTTTPSVSVLPFQLPVLPAGQRIVSATFSVNLEGWNNLSGAPLRDVDLYGIAMVSSSNSASDATHYYVDGLNPAANPLAYLLQDNLVTPSDISSATSATGLTLPKTSQDIGWFIQALYDDGAVAGQHGFLVLSHDAAMTLMRYYTFTSANGTTLPKPVITLTTAVTGRNWYLDGTNGSDTNPGSVLFPWKTFNHAQASVQPGDSLFCTGELGIVTMYTSTGPNGELPYRAGTGSAWISYHAWNGKSQPHIAELIFAGSNYADKADAYLSFEGFLFSPGQVDTADYDNNNAINLKGAWHVTFTDCDIEGASLYVPNSALLHVPISQRFSPYTPISQDTRQSNPAITAGTAGNASFITIQNCRISNCGLGIMVADNESYYPPYVHPQQSHDWQILDNDIGHAAEDGIRFAGGDAGANSIVSGNRIHDQCYCQSSLAWYGYVYHNGVREQTALNGKQWQRVQQTRSDGTVQTGLVNFTRLVNATDGYSQFFVLADNKASAPLRNVSTPWVLVSDNTIQFRPYYQDGTANAGKPANGDSTHPDGISVMAMMTGGIFEKNRIVTSKYGGGGLKIENIPLHGSPRPPTDLLFENNLFCGVDTPPVNAATMIIAGGKNCWFVHNTIFGGSGQNPDGTIRFSVRDSRDKKMTTDADPEGVGIHFVNCIIGGGGLTNAQSTFPEYGHMVATSENSAWIRLPQTGATAGIAASSTDNVPPTGLTLAASIARLQFVNSATGDLRITSGSPAQNKGASSYSGLSLPTDDINGFTRTLPPDAGAYEVGSPIDPLAGDP